jgi:hypothetical protein
MANIKSIGGNPIVLDASGIEPDAVTPDKLADMDGITAGAALGITGEATDSAAWLQRVSTSDGPTTIRSIHGNTIQVTVAKAGMVKVQVFDMMGHTIESHSESMAAGSFAHTFGSMGKGAYIVRVQQGSMAKTIRMQVR